MDERPRVPRKPAPRRRRAGTPDLDPKVARIAGMSAVGALLLVLVIVIATIAGGGDGDTSASERSALETPTPSATPTATRTAAPTPKPLTAEQRQMRDLAADIVADRSFEVTRLRDFQPRRTLQVLIGRSGSGNEMAFFFVDGEYIGNDSTSTSKSITVRRGGDDTSVRLRYAVTSGDPVTITFRWDGTRLAPETPLPDPALRA